MLSCIRLFVTPWTAAQLPCASLSPGVCPSGQWYHPTISSSVVPFSSWPQSFPASGSFPVSQLFTSGGQSTGASASASVLPINIQGWFPLGLTSFQFSSVTQSCLTLCDPMDCSTPGLPDLRHSWSLLKLMSTELVMPFNHLVLCHPRLLPPSVFPTIRVFSNESALHIRWPMYWSFSFSISPSNQYSGLISFRIDWFDILAVQRTFKSLLQHHNSKASILRCSAFFMVQLSHPYMTTGKTIALTRWTFVGKVVSAFELWCWRRLLKVLWTARRSNQSILRESSPEYSLEGLMLKLKLQPFGHLMWRAD